MNLSGHQTEQLQNAILNTYSRGDLEQFVFFKLDERLDNITSGGNMRQSVFELIEWADRHGRLAELIQTAHADRPSNSVFAALARTQPQQLQTQPSREQSARMRPNQTSTQTSSQPPNRRRSWSQIAGAIGLMASVMIILIYWLLQSTSVNTTSISATSISGSTEVTDNLAVMPFYTLVDPLVRFSADASPSRVMVVHQDIYIMDRGRNQINRYRLGPNGEAVPDTAGEVVIRQGDIIDGFELGPIIDMAWQTASVGNEEKSVLIVLDSNNQVFQYDQVVDGVSRLAFGSQALWQSPTEIQSYNGHFYVADSGRGKVYRYASDNFAGEPDEWRSSPTDPPLSSLLSMMIDGDIWMLFSNGQLIRYHDGLTVPFVLDNDAGITEPVDIFIGEQEDSLIYLADAKEDRVLVFKKDGTYLRQHKAAEGTPLRGLRSIFVDESTDKIYLLTHSGLYQHPLSE